MKTLFDSTSFQSSKLVTRKYSTSFSMGIRLLAPSIRNAVYAIYGFVRYADEIVDSFHDYDQKVLLDEFIEDYHRALERGISLNPILNSFQQVVHEYKLYDLVEDFLSSMRMDLHKTEYSTREEYEKYIHGSADVVGLMCLKIFVVGDEEKYEYLKGYAKHLGSAFQKVNFLRDIKNDFNELGRSYFPNIADRSLDNDTKEEIIRDIEFDFSEAYKGIRQLPVEGRLGVYIAYRYYLKLLKKLKRKDSKQIMKSRIRVSDPMKMLIFFKSFLRYKLNIL
jgi:phytoene/squalene synthetase